MKDATMRKLAAHFLSELGDRYGNDGCNDFDLAEMVPDVEERRAIMLEAEIVNGTPDEFRPTDDYRIVANFVVVSAVESWIARAK